jgi:uncharacterized Fe-S radical SAM superfamily protein PflX
MDQYYPAGRVSDSQFIEINRKITASEYEDAVEYARRAGLWRIDERRFPPSIFWN